METQNTVIFTAKTSNFEGPFGLLLELVEKRKLFINDVSLAAVTDDYLNYMNRLEGTLPPGEIASFILVASTLVLIKSKSLLPNLDLSSEEQSDIRSLEERLRLYELFTKLGRNIKSDFGNKIIFAPQERKNDTLIFLPDEQITRDSMMGFAKEVLGSMPKKAILPEVEVKKVISIEEMIDNLTERIQKSIQTSFKSFTGKVKTKEEKLFAIVGFLAMLELVRSGIMNVVQNNNFDDIVFEKQSAPLEPIN